MKMKWPDVDQYIQDFERVTRKAEYPLTAPATVRYFLKGLTKSIVNNIVKPPKVNTYTEIKQRAIDSVVISSASGMERGEVFDGPTDWLGSCDPMTPYDIRMAHRFGLDD
jgi:hypothetical protein